MAKLKVTHELSKWVEKEHLMLTSQAWDFCQEFVDKLYATQPIDELSNYRRPDLDVSTIQSIAEMVRKKTNTHRNSADDIRVAFMAVCLENARLLKEVNEHRAARGLPSLPVYEPR